MALCCGVLCGSLNFGVDAPAEKSGDDYKIFVKNETNDDIFFAFRKTNVMGNLISSGSPEEQRLLAPLIAGVRVEVNVNNFPALARSKKLSERATQYTRLFVSTDPESLKKKLQGESLTPDEKKVIISEKVPQQPGAYCSGDIFFIVRPKGTTLSVNVVDNRICMRSGSKEAVQTRAFKEEEKMLRMQERAETQRLRTAEMATKAELRKAQEALRVAEAQKQQALQKVEQVAGKAEAEEELAKTRLELAEAQETLEQANKNVVQLRKMAKDSSERLKTAQTKDKTYVLGLEQRAKSAKAGEEAATKRAIEAEQLLEKEKGKSRFQKLKGD